MTSVSTDRRFGVNAGAALKVPVKAATTAAITLSGEQTIDGVACVTDDRVLVKDQASGVANGIYAVDTGDWTRTPDFDGAYDVKKGTFVYVTGGTTNTGFWYVTTANPITAGTTSLTFERASSVLAAVSAFMQTVLDDADALAAKSTLKVPKPAVNLFPNSELSICTAIPLARVGNAVPIQSFVASGVDTGVVVITAAVSAVGHAGGIVPGKLFLVDGSGTPHAPHVALSGTVTVSGGTKRITCAAATFGGVEVGDVMYITGGTNTSPKARYRITATDASTYVEAYGFTTTTLVTEGPVTFDITWYEGSKDVDTTMNGMPSTGDPVASSYIGYPLMATECSVGSFKATLAGKNLNAAGSAAETAWEATPGDTFGLTGDAADGWGKTTSLRYWRTYKKDWDGTTSVVKNGADYGCKVQKGGGTEYLYAPLTAVSPVNHSDGTYIPEKLAQFKGKTVTVGFYWWPASANTARAFIFDGLTFTYSDYFSAGAMSWEEVTATIPDGADRVISGIEITGVVGDIHYGTQPMAIFGSEIGEGNYVPTSGVHIFSSHPNFWSYMNAAVPKNALIRIEQESVGALPRGLKAVFAQVEMQNSAPPSQNPVTGIALWDSPASRLPGITVYDFWGTQMIAFSTGGSTVAAGATNYFGAGAAGATDALSQQIRVPFAFAAVNLYVQTSTGPVGAETFTYTLRKQNVDTTLTTSMTGAATQASDTTRSHKVTGNAGDVLDVKVVASAGAAVALHNATLELYNTSHTLSCNAGLAAIGKYSETTPTWLSDCLYVEVGESPSSGVNGVNIDMFAAAL